MALPGRSSRIALINHFALSRQMPLPPDIVEFLAEKLTVTPRELLATVIQLETCAQHEKSTVDLGLAKRYVQGEINGPAVTLAEITRGAAREFGLSMSDIRGRTRLNGLVLARHCAMFLARELTGKSLQAIAEFFGGRRHSTVAHACSQLEKRMVDEPDLRQHLAQIRGWLGVTASHFRS